MDTATFIYTYGGVEYQRSIEILSFRGMAEPDEIDIVGVTHEYLNGSMAEQIIGFRKIVEVRVAPRSDGSDRRFLTAFVLSTAKTIVYGAYVSELVNESFSIQSEWLGKIELNRQFTLRLVDNHVYKSWTDAALADADMYCKLNVQITGTSGSPQTFTTGTAPLALMETTEAWPVFSDTTHVHTVVLTPTGTSQFTPCLVGNPSVTAGNVTFQAFVGDSGQVPKAADGLYYMDVKIFLQEKP